MRKLGWTALILLAVLFAVSLSNGRVPAPPAASPRSDTAFVVPVVDVSPAQLVDSWHDARDGGARVHEALDIAAPAGTPVVAAMAGRVEKLFLSNAGGITAYVRSADGTWVAYYAHLQRYAAGLAEGQVLKPGALVGFVGDTGNAGVGNTHLHFALASMRPGEKWHQGTPVNPYPLLAGKPSAR